MLVGTLATKVPFLTGFTDDFLRFETRCSLGFSSEKREGVLRSECRTKSGMFSRIKPNTGIWALSSRFTTRCYLGNKGTSRKKILLGGSRSRRNLGFEGCCELFIAVTSYKLVVCWSV